jgi:hypothetical protein
MKSKRLLIKFKSKRIIESSEETEDGKVIFESDRFQETDKLQ